ncbi:MAG: M48 family metalloprotease, partial [Ruminiclostridium sp.]|nr:M48 family metalloprotease [Ruminiclostridium sp.]
MDLSDEKIRGFMKRLLISRMRILCNHGLFGLLLMHIIYSLDDNTDTAYTDGERIAFSPDFLDGLSDSELDFVMMHEILHIVLQHCLRSDENDPELYNIAADIVVNSIIMAENGGDPRSITLSKYGESMHKAPDGKEGSIYTAEEIFKMLYSSLKSRKRIGKGNASGGEDSKEGGSGKADGSDKDTSKEENSDRGISGNNENTPPAREEGRAKKKQAKPQSGNYSRGTWDDHSRWGETENDDILRDVWVKRFYDACKAISIRDAANSRGTLPMFAQRMLEELMKPQTDWRRILSDFI